MEKLNKGQLFNFIGYIILIGWTLLGGLDALNKTITSFELSPLLTGTVFLLAKLTPTFYQTVILSCLNL